MTYKLRFRLWRILENPIWDRKDAYLMRALMLHSGKDKALWIERRAYVGLRWADVNC